MAAYTITTTPREEALLTWIVQQFNLEQDKTLTNDQFVALRFIELLKPYMERYRLAQLKSVQEKFNDATPLVQQQVKTLLGIS